MPDPHTRFIHWPVHYPVHDGVAYDAHYGSGDSTVTAMTLTAVPANRVWQRSISDTDGPVALAGTYTGGAPTGVEARILLDLDDSEVVGWTTLSGQTIGGGAWSGTVTVPQGGLYYAEVRALNAPLVGATGATTWYVGAVFLLSGQSNANHIETTGGGSPAAASAGTVFYDRSANTWGTVPNTESARALMNGLRSALGIPVAFFNVAQDAIALDVLLPGGSNFDSIFTPTIAIVKDFEATVFVHGEGGSSGGTKADYVTKLDTLHSGYAGACTPVRTVTQQPFALSGLGTASDGTITEESWTRVQAAQLSSHNPAGGQYFSHSNIDLPRVDDLHYTVGGLKTLAERFVQTLTDAITGTGAPAFLSLVATGTYLTTTTTSVDLTHQNGTDFTPTTGIAGFEVSGDNGGTWDSATGARVDANTITLTHSNIGGSDRLVRYLWGKNPTITDSVEDNSSLTVPMAPPGTDFVTVDGPGSTPMPTFKVAKNLGGTSTPQTTVDLDCGDASVERLVIIGLSRSGGSTVTSATLTPSGGSGISATVYNETSGGNPCHAWLVFVMPQGTANSNDCDFTVSFAANPFGGAHISVWIVPTADLVSQVPVRNSSRSASAAARTATVTASVDGFILGIGSSGSVTSNTCTWTSSEVSPVERADAAHQGEEYSFADGVPTPAGSTSLTCTFVQTAAIRGSGAHWR